jgi:tetratricopeptide (TPR) repeat protein
MSLARVTVAALLVLGGLALSAPAPARADDRSEAKAHYDKATASYALGRYADAAAEFEQAFALKPDPAILYNAAQAYRLAGKKERALELYRNYRRVYGRRAEHAPDVDKHIVELEKAIESDHHASSAESTGLANLEPGATPMGAAPAAAPQPLQAAAPAAAPVSAPPVLVAQPGASSASAQTDTARPIYTRWWFWAGAGAVVAAVVVGALVLSRKTTDCGPGIDYCANTGL